MNRIPTIAVLALVLLSACRESDERTLRVVNLSEVPLRQVIVTDDGEVVGRAATLGPGGSFEVRFVVSVILGITFEHPGGRVSKPTNREDWWCDADDIDLSCRPVLEILPDLSVTLDTSIYVH